MNPFIDHPQTDFFTSLKKRVDNYFQEKKLDKAGNTRLIVKGITQILLAAGLYTTLVFFTPGIIVSILLCVMLGINLAVIGFNVMHEGGHQSFSRHAWLNNASAYFLNVLGGNTHYWKIKHNINHHTFTNIEGMDSDIDVRPFMRLHEGQPFRPYHRYQHLYWPALYGSSYLAWVFYEDFQKYFSQRVSVSSARKPLPLKEHLIFWISKVMYVTAYIAVPIMMIGWLPWLVGFLIVTSVCGVAISIVFQLAHVVEGTAFYHSHERKKHEWAVQQISSTANFATSNKSLFWLLGGLNFQIEHHLFPRISHIHYPAISKFVRDACSKHNIVYHEYRTMARAISSHLLHLRRMSQFEPSDLGP